MANMQSMNRTEALRLADALSQGRYLTTDAGNPIAEAAAELRRLHARIAELEAKASENYWLLYAMKEQELWYQDELVEEAKRTAAEKLRADQMTEQHRMQSAMNTEARGELAQLREKRQPLSPLEAIKLGMKADDECRKHARGTTNWACAMTRFYEAAHNITGEPA